MRIRPLETGDTAGVTELFARLSPESRRRRFLTPKPNLSRGDLRLLTDIDHVRHEALAAEDERDASIVGIARYVQTAHRPAVAEVAIAVADELQGIRIGTTLIDHLVERARTNGFDVLEARTLWENRAARALLRRAGFHARSSQGTEIELELRLVNPGTAPGSRS